MRKAILIFQGVYVMKDAASEFWQRVLNTTEKALTRGDLKPISTQIHPLTDAAMTFKVRVVDSIARKEATQKTRQNHSGNQPFNPFLPYEEALFVADLSASHICLLNKFNVVDHHLLLVTREYESQDTWLTEADFEALVQCLVEIDGLGFYNGGTDAGASQPHKHLQLIPFVPGQASTDLPIATVIQAKQTWLQAHTRLPELPFWHGITLLATSWSPETVAATAQHLHKTYQQLMIHLGLNLAQPLPGVPYNLLVTRDWMMAVRRSQGSFQGIGVNALGYGGWLLVKNPSDLARLKAIGPMQLLQIVGASWSPQRCHGG